MNYKVLIVEDEREIAELVKLHLDEIGCCSELAFDGLAGSNALSSRKFDLIVLDLMLPGESGLDICRKLRVGEDYTPILMLTSRASELDRVLGLELGADDYLTKPFSVLELQARVKALFRRVKSLTAGVSASAPVVRSGAMEIDPDRRAVTVDGREVELTSKEFDLLLHLARNPGRVYSRAQLLDVVWGYNHCGYEHTVNSHINRLRGKIERNPAEPSFVKTVWGVGYKFAEFKETRAMDDRISG